MTRHAFDSDPDYRDESSTDVRESQRWRWVKRSLVIAAMIIIGGYVFVELFVGKNDLHTWQVLQFPNGSVEVRNRPGWYFKSFAKVSTYPRMITVYATKKSTVESPKDDSVHVQFNDGGSADISWVARVATPCPEKSEDEGDASIIAKQREFHRQFMGNVDAANNAVRSAVRNIIPQTGPIMSSTENQAARKGEFWKLIYDQLREGLYKTKPVEVKANSGIISMMKAIDRKIPAESAVKDPAAAKKVGETVILEEHAITASQTVVAAEIVVDPKTGKPVISNPAPLNEYGMSVLQFSIIETDYDQDTLKKFSDKKKLYLEAERSKAAAIENVQKRFQREAQGNREVAEKEWDSEKERTRQRIVAETRQEREVLVKEKMRLVAETAAKIADVNKHFEEVQRQIADVQAQIALNDKQAVEIVAKAREQQIEIAGAISDHDKQLAEISVKEAEQVAKALQQLKVPETVILSPQGLDPAKGTAMQQAMPSMQLLRLFGLLQENQDLRVPAPAHTAPKPSE